MKRKEIQQLIIKELSNYEGLSTSTEVFGSIGLCIERKPVTSKLVIVWYGEEIKTLIFREEAIDIHFGDILNNNERVRQNKIRKFVKEMC